MPFPWAPIIMAGGSLLASLLSGAQKAKERKRSKEDYWELLKKRLEMIKGEFKPKTERYAIEKHLPQWDEFMKKAIMGNWGKAYGQKGIEMPSVTDYLAQMFETSSDSGGETLGGFGGQGMGMPSSMNAMANRRFAGMGQGGMGQGGMGQGGLGRGLGRRLM